MTSWESLFDRADGCAASEAEIVDALAERRTDTGGERHPDEPDEGDATGDGAGAGDDIGGVGHGSGPAHVPDPSPGRVVADADVLAADLLVGGPSRAALDHLREHTWTTLVASDQLLADAESVIAELADRSLASDWRDRVGEWRDPVAHPAGDHPALASAARGGAMHVLSLDERLTGASSAVRIRDRVETSVRPPDAFARLFDPASLYREVVGGDYPGPDRDPRA